MDWGWVPVPHPPFHTRPAKDPRRSLEHSLKTLTLHECIPPITCPGLESHATSLYLEDHRQTHPCRRRIQSHPGCSLGASPFYLCLKKKSSYFVFPSGVGAWDNFISSNLFTVFLFERPEPAEYKCKGGNTDKALKNRNSVCLEKWSGCFLTLHDHQEERSSAKTHPRSCTVKNIRLFLGLYIKAHRAFC